MDELPQVAKVAGHTITWADVGVTAALAGFMGLVRHLQQFRGDTPPAFKLWKATIDGLTAVAAGGLALLVCRELGTSENWRWVFISLAGWGGPEVITAATAAIIQGIATYANRKAQTLPDQGPKV